jgi:ElaB/YqjD/DUF883 family membrane-anchored ribosome-binding protein
MPHERDHVERDAGSTGAVRNNPQSRDDRLVNDMTQQSGYTPATEITRESALGNPGSFDSGRGQQVKDRASETGQQVKDKASDATQKAQDKASEVGQQAKDKASEVGQKAQEKVDEGMNTAAGGMESTAQKIREKTEGSGAVGEAGAKVADTMERTAGYLRENDTSQLMDDLENYVREHPMQAIAGAVIGGFVISRILR